VGTPSTFFRASLAFALAGLPVVGQALHVSSVSGSHGDNVVIEISLVSTVRESPETLKWETSFPAQLLEAVGSPEAGSASKEAGKSLTCTQREPYLYVCILAGGRSRSRTVRSRDFRSEFARMRIQEPPMSTPAKWRR